LAGGHGFKPKFGDTDSSVYFKGGEKEELTFKRLLIAENE
jgi:hypothetical protein